MTAQAEKEQRLDMLAGLKAQGYSYSQLVRLSCQQWQISERQAKRYLQEIEQRERQLASGNADDYFGQFLSRCRYIYGKAMQTNQLDLARKLLLDELQAFQKLKKPYRGKQDDFISTAPAVQTDELAELYAHLEREGLTGSP